MTTRLSPGTTHIPPQQTPGIIPPGGNLYDEDQCDTCAHRVGHSGPDWCPVVPVKPLATCSKWVAINPTNKEH